MHTHERLLLLGLEAKIGLPYSQFRPFFGLALAAAAVADLELLGRLKFGEDTLVVLDASATDVPVLDRALETLAKGKAACEIDKSGRCLLAAVKLTELCGARYMTPCAEPSPVRSSSHKVAWRSSSRMRSAC